MSSKSNNLPARPRRARRRSRGRETGAIALFAATAAAMSLAPSRQTFALTFDFAPTPGTSQQAIDGFTVAGERWSSLFADNVTLHINIDFVPLAGGVLASTGNVQSNYTYTSTRAALVADATSDDDTTATGSLPAAPAAGMFINYTSNSPSGAGSATPYFDNNASGNNTSIRVHHANAKALGLRSANNASDDASIGISSSFAWDFNPYDGITAGAYDFVGVATREIGHALGFSSGVDLLDANSAAAPFLADDEVHAKALDLFRYSAESRAQGVGVFDMSADARAKYFSINGGTTNLATFATGRTRGDGQPAGHWKDNLGLGIMDPTAPAGTQLFISALDRRALDVIGWNTSNTFVWMDPAGGAFSSAIRWSSTVVPSGGEEAVWRLNNTYTISFAAGQTTASAQVRSGNVTFALGGTTYNAGAFVNVAPAAGEAATLNISTGTLSGAVVNIGGTSAAAGGTGMLSVDIGATLNAPAVIGIWSGGTLRFNGGTVSTGQIQLSGGTIHAPSGVSTVMPITANGGTAQIDAGTHTINGTLTTTGGTFNKTGAGALVIAGPQSHAATAVLQASAGTTMLMTNAGSVASPGTLSVIANAIVSFQSTQNLKSLTVGPGAIATLAAGGTRSIKTGAIAINTAGGGKLDLKDNRLVVDYTGPSTVLAVHDLLAAGHNAGTWDGPGINSSTAGSSGNFSLGYGEARDILAIDGLQTATWGGQTVDATAIVVRYTYTADANLDGFVSADDYSAIDFNVTIAGARGFWNGDFNYDGFISADDYSAIDYMLVAQGAPFPASAGWAFGLAAAGEVKSVTSVPEPAACAFASVIAAIALMRRHRDRRDG